MAAEGSDSEEAFVGLAEGQVEEGAQVLADLEGTAEGETVRSIPLKRALALPLLLPHTSSLLSGLSADCRGGHE